MTPTSRLERSRNSSMSSPTGTCAARGKLAAYQTLYETLTTVSRLMAPFVPFMADAMYRNLSNGNSVHLSDFPQALQWLDPEVEANMARARQAVEAGLAARDAVRIRVRQPLASIALPGE